MQQFRTKNCQIIDQTAVFFGRLFGKPLDFQRRACRRIGCGWRKSLKGRGNRWIDDGLRAVCDAANNYRRALRELNHQLGCSHPNEHRLQSLGERAVKSALMFSPFKIEHMAPSERRSFAQLTEAWVAMINRRAQERQPDREAAE
jgi:hypothetical protein